MNTTNQRIFAVKLEDFDLEIINDFHLDLALTSILAPSIAKTLIDASFDSLSLGKFGYESTSNESAKLTLREIVQRDRTALLEEASAGISFHRQGDYYVACGNEELLDAMSVYYFVEEVAPEDILQNIGTISNPLPEATFMTDPIHWEVTFAFDKLFSKENPNTTSDSAHAELLDDSVINLYHSLINNIAFLQEYFAHKMIDGVGNKIYSLTTISDEDKNKIPFAVEKAKEYWKSLVDKPVKNIQDYISPIEYSIFDATLEDFIEFLPDAYFTDEIYVNIYQELGLYEEF